MGKNVFMAKRGAYCILYDIPGALSKLHSSQIFYSVKNISPHFDNKQSLWQTLSDLEKNVLAVNMFPTIRVVKQNKKWISLDNRRLFVFQNSVNCEVPVFIIPQHAPLESYRSVNVLDCSCKCCVFGQNLNRGTVVSKRSLDDSYARSCAWRLFLKEKKPPSALLLAHSCILPSVDHFHVAKNFGEQIKKSFLASPTRCTKRMHTVDNMTSCKKWKGSNRKRTILQHIDDSKLSVDPLHVANGNKKQRNRVRNAKRMHTVDNMTSCKKWKGSNKRTFLQHIHNVIPLTIIDDGNTIPATSSGLPHRIVKSGFFEGYKNKKKNI